MQFYGLQDLNALARVCFYAQELSILTESPPMHPAEVVEVKRALDGAFNDLLGQNKEKHEPN